MKERLYIFVVWVLQVFMSNMVVYVKNVGIIGLYDKTHRTLHLKG